MGYQNQQVNGETLELKQAEFDAALKAYQEKATNLSLQIEQATRVLEGILLDQNNAQTSLTAIKSECDALMLKKNHLESELNVVMQNKVAELDARTEEAMAAINTEAAAIEAKQAAFAKEREEFQAGLKVIADGQAALNFRESQLVKIEQALRERESKIESSESRLAAQEATVLAMHAQVDDRHKLLDEREARVKAKQEQLENHIALLDSEQAKWRSANEELQKKEKSLADLNTERVRLATDLKEFNDAKGRLELREAALSALEQQLKRWEQDLKQQEDVLIAKAKGE